jgi:hypothetical protein
MVTSVIRITYSNKKQPEYTIENGPLNPQIDFFASSFEVDEEEFENEYQQSLKSAKGK